MLACSEGADYSVIYQLLTENIHPGQILVEFHHRFKGIGVDKTKKALNLLKKMGYKIFAISSTGEEYSFILQNPE